MMSTFTTVVKSECQYRSKYSSPNDVFGLVYLYPSVTHNSKQLAQRHINNKNLRSISIFSMESHYITAKYTIIMNNRNLTA
jgi:hypothetical protein